MKACFVILLGLALNTTSYANGVKLFVENLSDKTIVIQKHDGSTLKLISGEIITSEFDDHSTVVNIVDGKVACTWEINQYPRKGVKMNAISYELYDNEYKCINTRVFTDG